MTEYGLLVLLPFRCIFQPPQRYLRKWLVCEPILEIKDLKLNNHQWMVTTFHDAIKRGFF